MTKAHDIEFNQHNYIINEETVKDLNNINKEELLNKFKDIKYLQIFLKKYAVKNNAKVTSASKLYNIFNEEFGEIDLDYDSLNAYEKEKYLQKIKKIKKLTDEEITKINIKELLNIKILCIGAYTQLRNQREFNKEMAYNLQDLKIKDKKVVVNLKVNFQRKDKYYQKDIFIIMSNEMEDNIKKDGNIQYFMDVTYYATPPNTQKYKLLTVLAFNRIDYKSIICCLAIIQNENKETFIEVLSYLKTKYIWNPERITIDYSRAERNAILYVFPNIQIIPCFFHFIFNCTKKLKELKSKSSTLKNAAKDCLSNIKLLSFVPLNKFDNFYELINPMS